MAYLGKISAIVSANPINLQKGLSDAANSVRLFGQSVEKNRPAQSPEQILAELMKLNQR